MRFGNYPIDKPVIGCYTPIMTKKDFQLIADAINLSRKGVVMDGSAMAFADELVRTLCVVLKKDNPRFDSVRFKRACIGLTANPFKDAIDMVRNIP